MSTPAPTNPHAAPSDPSQPVKLGFEQALHEFWLKNSRTIYIVCVAILAAIIIRGGIDIYIRWHDAKISAAYGAATTPEKLKAFAAANAGHALAGAAKLRLADEAYSNGNYTQAVADYQGAIEILKKGVLADRARLGVAMAKLMGGQTSEAESQLKLIGNDASVLRPVRAEAFYQLASFISQSGRNEEALKYLDQVNAIDPTSSWVQRSMLLRMSIPTAATAPAPLSTKP